MGSAVDDYFNKINTEIIGREKVVGQQFARLLKNNLLESIKRLTKVKDGYALKTTTRFYLNKDGYLDRLVIFTPYYIFPILNTGFEGNKKNGVNMRMKARNFLLEAIENGKFSQDLADKIGENRADQIVARIQFLKPEDLA